MASASNALARSKVEPETGHRLLSHAVHRNKLISKEGLLERLFTFAFSNLVYAQIWEDPVIDMEALSLDGDSRIVLIASGGCNMMSYLTAGPAHITAVDLNPAHVALNRLKLAAARHLPSHAAFNRYFSGGRDTGSAQMYAHYLRPALDPVTRAYWESRDHLGRHRIAKFNRNFYRNGLLGKFITTAHLLAKMHGADPARMMAAKSIEDQRRIFETELAPLLNRPLIRWLIERPATLFGLGIPPAQYKVLAGDHSDGIGAVLHERLQRLACGFKLETNYFAWQAFARQYDPAPGGSVPPYLELRNYERLRAHIERADVLNVSLTKHLRQQPTASLNRYVLLDAQDWMSDADLNELWAEITRTAGPGARVIFRTAATPSLLPGRVSAEILNQWTYQAEQSKGWTDRDRSAIYGGFHLYVKKASRA